MIRLCISKTEVIRSCPFYDCENEKRNKDLLQFANRRFALILVHLNGRNYAGVYTFLQAILDISENLVEMNMRRLGFAKYMRDCDRRSRYLSCLC